jgi:type 1 glutamine amidotransferase
MFRGSSPFCTLHREENIMKTTHCCNSATWCLLLTTLLFLSCGKPAKENETSPVQVLMYSRTKAFRHECIEPGQQAIQVYFEKFNVDVTITEDSSVFTTDALHDYDVVMFFQTTGNVLDSVQQEAFETYYKSGKGFVGIHAAADTEYDWPWYGKLVGAYFASHPDVQQHVVEKVDTSHLSCKHLPSRWKRTDECYNFKSLPVNVHVLLTADETTYQGGTHGDFHPLAWYHQFDGGRSFYTALGHTVESYKDTLFLEHLRQAVVWAAGG